MKRILPFLGIVVLFISSCTKEDVETISLSPNVLQMKVGEMQTLTATASGTVEWQSSDTAVAEVYLGIVTAKGVGNATVTASCGKASAVCHLYVTGEDGSTIALRPAYLEVDKNSSHQLHVSSVYDVPLTWSSSDETVATVNSTGMLTTKKPGHTTITVTNGAESASCFVAVKHKWSEYKLVWQDEFNGTSLDASSWTIEVNGAGGGNQELQYYTDRSKNVRVEDGNLVIQAYKEDYSGRQYTSGRINSLNKRFFKYGKVEARIKFPAGGGTWPAFWMMGNDYSSVGWPSCGEIDIIEHIGNDPRMLSNALHYPYKHGGNCWSKRSYKDNVENQYHVYGIEWVEEEEYGRDVIRFTYDGEVIAYVSETLEGMDINYMWPFNKDFFIIFNLAIGGSMAGNVDDSIFAHDIKMYVDWVRVYQHNEID